MLRARDWGDRRLDRLNVRGSNDFICARNLQNKRVAPKP